MIDVQMASDGRWQVDAADQNFDYMFKLLIIGNSSVGKTSLRGRHDVVRSSSARRRSCFATRTTLLRRRSSVQSASTSKWRLSTSTTNASNCRSGSVQLSRRDRATLAVGWTEIANLSFPMGWHRQIFSKIFGVRKVKSTGVLPPGVDCVQSLPYIGGVCRVKTNTSHGQELCGCWRPARLTTCRVGLPTGYTQ